MRKKKRSEISRYLSKREEGKKKRYMATRREFCCFLGSLLRE